MLNWLLITVLVIGLFCSMAAKKRAQQYQGLCGRIFDIAEGDVNWMNPSYPNSDIEELNIEVHIRTGSDKFCFLEIKFKEFTLSQPTRGECLHDVLMVNGTQYCGQEPVDLIRGEDHDHFHAIKPISMSEPVSMTITTKGNTFSRIWRIKVHGVSCKHTTEFAGCTQYNDEYYGGIVVRTFNYPYSMVNGLLTTNEPTVICIRKSELGSVDHGVTGTTLLTMMAESNAISKFHPDAFSLDAQNGAGSRHDTQCPAMYVKLVGQIGGQHDTYCGGHINSESGRYRHDKVVFSSKGDLPQLWMPPVTGYTPGGFRLQMTAEYSAKAEPLAAGSVSILNLSAAVFKRCPRAINGTQDGGGQPVACFYYYPAPPVYGQNGGQQTGLSYGQQVGWTQGQPSGYGQGYGQYYGQYGNPDRMGSAGYPGQYSQYGQYGQQGQYGQRGQPYGDYRGQWPVFYGTIRDVSGYQNGVGAYRTGGEAYQNGGSGYTYPQGYMGPGVQVYGPPAYYGSSQYWDPRMYQGYQQYDNYQQYSDFQRRSRLVTPKTEEPIFFGFGSVQFVSQRDVELGCDFNDVTIKVVSNAAWVKVTGPYDVYQAQPPFECTQPGCNLVHFNLSEDFRYRVITTGPVSNMRIYDMTPADYGVYRCAATGLESDGTTRTLYRIVAFQPPPPQPYGKK
ncbi:hypothetical protein HDE_06734 [Halotydeus destructor]|nr:hypothetical protein HDE_06734 [Halotydeus destructor]